MSTRPFGTERHCHRADVDRDVLRQQGTLSPGISDWIELSGRDADAGLEESMPDEPERQRRPEQLC